MDLELLKEYINTKYSLSYRVEVINSSNIEKFYYQKKSSLNNNVEKNEEKEFWIVNWSGWRINHGGENWIYRNNMKSLRFNYESFQEWICQMREKKLIDLI